MHHQDSCQNILGNTRDFIYSHVLSLRVLGSKHRLCPLPQPYQVSTQLFLSRCLSLFPWPPREVGSACDLCLEGRILVQYAFNASSPMPCGPSGHWSPREAEGKSEFIGTCGIQKITSFLYQSLTLFTNLTSIF